MSSTWADAQQMVANFIIERVNAYVQLIVTQLGQFIPHSVLHFLPLQQITDMPPFFPLRDPKKIVGYLGDI